MGVKNLNGTLDSYNDFVKNLIVQVRTDDQEAFGEMLQLYEPLIGSFTARFVSNGASQQDAEDFRQELTMSFYNAILSYDLEQTEVSFGLYAKICLNNFFITQLRTLKKRKSAEMISLDQENWLMENQSEQGDPSSDVIQREKLRELNRKIESTLSDFENKVWKYYVSGCSSREIAQALDKSEKSIENAVFRIRQKLKGLFA